VETEPSNPIIIIPARLGSTRLPNKPLADISGVPMIVHVMNRAKESSVGRVVVACAEHKIADAVTKAGGEAIITLEEHASGSDRIYEALTQIDPNESHDAVIGLQGDLPTISPKFLKIPLQLLSNSDVDIGTLAAEIKEKKENNDPNVVKAIVSVDHINLTRGKALYFSRSCVPWGDGQRWHHIGVYAYRRAALKHFVTCPSTQLEKREKLEQLRALEIGLRIEVAFIDTVPLGVDTWEDLEMARNILN